jgi:enoyl-CoA hydratase/carnithine racemase
MAGEIHREVIDDAVWLTIANPPRGVLDPRLMRELASGLADADDDPAVKAVVLTGSSEAFCAGLDVEALRSGADPVEFARELVALLQVLPKLGKPVLAAVNGDALASGFSLVVACDYAVAAAGARLGTYEASFGNWPMIAQVPPLQRLLPRHALENILSGEPFTTERALDVGAINAIVPGDELADTVRRQVPRLVVAGQNLARGRRSFYRFLGLSYDDALEQSFEEFVAMIERTS